VIALFVGVCQGFVVVSVGVVMVVPWHCCSAVEEHSTGPYPQKVNGSPP
jgi:hypothetical protein